MLLGAWAVLLKKIIPGHNYRTKFKKKLSLQCVKLCKLNMFNWNETITTHVIYFHVCLESSLVVAFFFNFFQDTCCFRMRHLQEKTIHLSLNFLRDCLASLNRKSLPATSTLLSEFFSMRKLLLQMLSA